MKPYLAAAWMTICCAIAAEPIGRLADLRALPTELAATGRPVLVTGVVLGLDPAAPFHFFMHDGSAGCFTKTRRGGRQPSLKPGDRVRVEGLSDALGYFPSMKEASVTILGHGQAPEPIKPNPGEMFAPSLDSEWVEVPATVMGFDLGDDRLTLTVEVYGQPFKAEIPMSPGVAQRAADLVQKHVILQGVLGTIFNLQRQMTDRHFFVPSPDYIRPIPAGEIERPIPLVDVARLLTAGFGPETPVRVIGTVTQPEVQGFYIRDATGSTLVHTGMADRFATGTRVEIEGFGVVSPFRPTLRATKVNRLGSAEVRPAPLDPSHIDAATLQSEWVTLDAGFLGQRNGPSGEILQFSAKDRFFEAMLPKHHDPGLPKPTPGDLVRICGICELTTTHALPRPAWIDGFRIHLPASGGMTIIRQAPWWNTRRLLGALGVTSAIASIGALATFLLRRQVGHQMKIISANLRAEAVSEERDRMARELHDTLEQQLSGVALQLDGLDHVFRNNPERAASSLQLARKMLRHTRIEARRSVWDLRSKVLEEKGLAAALSAMAEAASTNGPTISFEVSGDPPHLTAGVEFHLLRIAQEATTNAIKHSGASTVRILLASDHQGLSLEIKDNGCGFDTTAARNASTDGFGMLGMRERAEKIAGRLSVWSSPESGTSVTVTVRIPSSAQVTA